MLTTEVQQQEDQAESAQEISWWATAVPNLPLEALGLHAENPIRVLPARWGRLHHRALVVEGGWNYRRGGDAENSLELELKEKSSPPDRNNQWDRGERLREGQCEVKSRRRRQASLGTPGFGWKRWKLQELEHNTCCTLGRREPPVIISHDYVSDTLLDT